MSIDVGMARSAYCLLNDDYEIKDWDILEMPDCNSYDIRSNYLMVCNCQGFIEKEIKPGINESRPPPPKNCQCNC